MLTSLTFALLPLLSPSSETGGAPPAAGSSLPAESWSQWRGATRDGRTAGNSWGPDVSPEHLEERWRVADLGPSYSGPVADAECVFTTETVDKTYEVVQAYRRKTGERLWRTSWKGAMQVPFFAARNGSWIRSTPALDQEAIYVVGMRDVLVCLEKRSGKIRWSVDFTERLETPLPPFGGVCSPLLRGEHVYIQAGTSLLKLEKATGKTLWRSLIEESDMMNAGSFSSPVFAEFHGRPQLVAQSRSQLAGVDLVDGKELWSTPVKAYRGMNILTPTVFEGGVFTTAYGGRSQYFVVAGDALEASVESAWNSNVQGYMTSPVVLDGKAYLFLKSNRFGCIDLSTGESLWTSPPTGDEYWSLALQGDRILALSDSGVLRLIQADPSGYRVLSEREVTSSETWAHVAPVGDQVFVRAQDALIALEWK